jgi:hypothetical protein
MDRTTLDFSCLPFLVKVFWTSAFCLVFHVSELSRLFSLVLCIAIWRRWFGEQTQSYLVHVRWLGEKDLFIAKKKIYSFAPTSTLTALQSSHRPVHSPKTELNFCPQILYLELHSWRPKKSLTRASFYSPERIWNSARLVVEKSITSPPLEAWKSSVDEINKFHHPS